ncbi:twin-arginine translocase TatA/TatE family subunit [Kribbella sp. NPDC049584]|uniref:twin-arginine translocase TatA/TatE family subunit n=1 Tax=Kribbella sp. NPDC049584 TaxID=3154833 RepID=UPI003419F5A6
MVPLLALPEGGEWIVILVIVVLLFGAKKLPELTKNAARAMKEFEKARHGDDDDDTPAQVAPAQSQPQAVQAAQAAPVQATQAAPTQPTQAAPAQTAPAPSTQPQPQAAPPQASPTQPPADSQPVRPTDRPTDAEGGTAL